MLEIWSAVVGLLITGVPLLLVQVGGRRGLMRRAIREELELIGLLGDPVHVGVRDRLHRRVATRLEQYEPGAGARRRRRQGQLLATTEFVVLMLVAVVVLNILDVESTGASIAIGAALGMLGAVAHILIASRLDKREQDEAVGTVKLEATLPRKQAHFDVRTDPEQADRDK